MLKYDWYKFLRGIILREDFYLYGPSEEELAQRRQMERRRAKRAEQRRRRRKQVLINRCIFGAVCALFLIGLIFLIKFTVTGISKIFRDDKEETQMLGSDDSELYESYDPMSSAIVVEEPEPEPEPEPVKAYEAHLTDSTITTGSDVISERSILIDLETGDILMQKGYKDRISPASMTKVLTVLVAAEHLSEDQLNDTFIITPEITSYVWKNDCSAVSWSDNETVTVRDLLYGTILPSGADAAVGLATYIAGSQEAFVDMMNEKIAELGLSESSHFTNCVGLYDENHYSTVYDMAIMMEAAIENDIALDALSTKKYTTTSTVEHPDGIEISNWFLRRIEDKDTGGEVIAAKTGFVNESKNCAVSYGIDHSGNRYIVCTQGSTSSWRCIYDHVAIYKQFEGKINNGGNATLQEIIEDEAETDGNM